MDNREVLLEVKNVSKIYSEFIDKNLVSVIFYSNFFTCYILSKICNIKFRIYNYIF